MTTMPNAHLAPSLWKLILICAIAAFFALLPAVAVPSIADYFTVSLSHAEGILTWYLLGYGIGPLLYGPLANRYGRKVTLYIGFSIALGAGLLSCLFISMHWFGGVLLARFIQGLGTTAGLVVGMMMIADTATQAQARRIFSLIILFFAFAPTLAMGCGGILTVHIGFISLFILMAVMMLVWLGLVLSLRETYTKAAVPIEIKNLLIQYMDTCRQRPFIYLVLVYAMTGAITYIYNGLAPLIAETQLHISAELYGELAIIPSCGLFFGALLSARWSQTQTVLKTIIIGLIFIAIAAITMLVAFLYHYLNLYTLLAPSLLLFLGAAIVLPSASMRAMMTAKNAALGSAVLNAIGLMLISVIVQLSSGALTLGAMILPVSILILIILCGFLLKVAT